LIKKELNHKILGNQGAMHEAMKGLITETSLLKLTDLVQDVDMAVERYFRTSYEFYDTALSYLEAWNKQNEDLSKLSSLLLDKVSTGEE
jgi:hypothetical protein